MLRLLKVIVPILIVIVASSLYYFVFTGIIKINSTRPPVASIQIDGKTVGYTPLRQRIRAGLHQVKIFKEGFETWEEEVEVRGTSPTAVSAKLRFLLQSDPTGAEVIMDGEHLGVTELAADLKPGMHIFEFKKVGYQSAKFRSDIPSDAGEPIPLVSLAIAEAPDPEKRWPQKAAGEPEFGAIQVTSTPDAKVYLDGYLQGETPMTIDKVLVGSYVLSLSKEGYRELRKTVYVEKGETTKFAGELNPESSD